MAEETMVQQEPQTEPQGQTAEPVTFSQEDVNKMLADQKADMEKLFDDKFAKKFASYKRRRKLKRMRLLVLLR